MNKFGFNFLVCVWLIPMIILDIIGNTTSTGWESEICYYAMLLHTAVGAYAIWACYSAGHTTDPDTARQHVNATDNTVVSFEKLGAFEYVYCVFLVVLAAASFYMHHDINKNSTGLVSIASLVWSFVDIAIGFLSAIQFYRMKSGAIVQLVHKVTDK